MPDHLLAEAFATSRLDLTPLVPDDALEMVDVLADAALYEFTGGRPPTLDALRSQYERQAVGRSEDGSETWLNWIIRTRTDGRAVGFVQATATDADRRAEIAWVVGVEWQGRGFATEAAQALVVWLGRHGVATISANIHPDHAASASVARRAGLEPTDRWVDGERTWSVAAQIEGD